MMNNLVQLQQMQESAQNLPQPGGGATAAGGASTGGMDPRTWALLPPDAQLKIIEQNAQSGLQIHAGRARRRSRKTFSMRSRKAPSSLQQTERHGQCR